MAGKCLHLNTFPGRGACALEFTTVPATSRCSIVRPFSHLCTLLGTQKQLSLPPLAYQDFGFTSYYLRLLLPKHTCQCFLFKNWSFANPLKKRIRMRNKIVFRCFPHSNLYKYANTISFPHFESRIENIVRGIGIRKLFRFDSSLFPYFSMEECVVLPLREYLRY